jgi:hypothetical protein
MVGFSRAAIREGGCAVGLGLPELNSDGIVEFYVSLSLCQWLSERVCLGWLRPPLPIRQGVLGLFFALG